jgi:hypothetical protein
MLVLFVLRLLMTLDFQSWKIGIVFDIFVLNNGEENLWNMYVFHPSHISCPIPFGWHVVDMVELIWNVI